MKGSGEKLTRKQEQAIAALLTAATLPEAAQACGVSEVTLWRWLQVPAFTTAYRAARTTLLETAITDLQRSCGKAAKVLVTIMEDTSMPPSSRVTAAVKVLEMTLKAREVFEIEERLRALEEHLAGPKRKRA